MSKIENGGYYWGGCPQCGGNDGYVNVYKRHWFVCDAHKTMWCIGDNLFSSCRHETIEEQRQAWIARGLDEYREVKPLPDLDAVEEAQRRGWIVDDL